MALTTDREDGDARPAAPRSVLVTWPDFDPEDAETGRRLREAGLELALRPKHGHRDAREVAELAARTVGAIVSTDPFDADVFAAARRLRVIARVGVGFDSIDVGAATAAGVAVTTTPGANETTVADHTLALMLCAVRRVAEHDRAVRRGEWNRTGAHIPWDLADSTVGLVGFGAIGRRVAERLRGFDVQVLAHDPAVDGEVEGPGVRRVELDELLASAQMVSVHAPLQASTRGLIGAAEIARMRADAILVNTSRGGVVDEEALLDALEQGRLRAAALDVFEEEPPRSERLRALPNVVLTPHVGGVSERSVVEMTRRAVDAVLVALDGGVPRGLVNPAVLAHPRFARAEADGAEAGER
jgi:phosphoglycerate dehydrogenase-like enzyme